MTPARLVAGLAFHRFGPDGQIITGPRDVRALTGQPAVFYEPYRTSAGYGKYTFGRVDHVRPDGRVRLTEVTTWHETTDQTFTRPAIVVPFGYAYNAEPVTELPQ